MLLPRLARTTRDDHYVPFLRSSSETVTACAIGAMVGVVLLLLRVAKSCTRSSELGEERETTGKKITQPMLRVGDAAGEEGREGARDHARGQVFA